MGTILKPETAMYVRQIRHGLEKLAHLYGEPVHIGCGMRRLPQDANEKGEHTLFCYFTNPDREVVPPDVEEMRPDADTCFLFHSFPPEKKDERPRLCRKPVALAQLLDQLVEGL